jgi:hypothetical protein
MLHTHICIVWSTLEGSGRLLPYATSWQVGCSSMFIPRHRFGCSLVNWDSATKRSWGFAWTPGWNHQGTKGSNHHWSKRPTMAHNESTMNIWCGVPDPEKRVHSIPTSRVTLQSYIQHSRFVLDMIPPWNHQTPGLHVSYCLLLVRSAYVISNPLGLVPLTSALDITLTEEPPPRWCRSTSWVCKDLQEKSRKPRVFCTAKH